MIGCICKLYNELLLIRLIVYFFPYKISGKNTYVIYEKHLRLFGKTCTCFPENMMMFLYH